MKLSMKTGSCAAILLSVIGPLAAQGFQAGEELRRVPRDFSYVAASPVRVNSSDVIPLTLAGGAIAATMAYDGTIRDRLVKLRRWSKADSFRKTGDALQFWGLGLGAGQMAFGAAKDDERTLDNGWLQFEGAGAASLSGLLLKLAVGRKRPGGNDPDYFKPFSSNSSFPSGHTLMAFTAAQITSEEYPSCPVRAFSYLLATGVGVSRIAADKHWAGDILGSAFIGVGIGHALYRAHQRPASDWHLLASADGFNLARSF